MRVTGSKVHRVWKCPASAILPQHAMDVDRPEWEPMRTKGQGVHSFLEVVGKVGRGAALADAPADVVPMLEALDLENLPVGLATEVSFCWNWQTGGVRELGRNLPRRADGSVNYNDADGVWVGDLEIPLTIDVVGLEEKPRIGGTIRSMRGYVGDYKSGHTKYPAPDMFGQTLLAAACVAKVYGCDDVVVDLLHIHDNGGHHAVRRIVNDWDLQAFEAELQDAMRSIQPIVVGRYTGDLEQDVEIRGPNPVEGPWCDYCPAFRGCPAKLALVRAIPEKLLQLGIRPGTLPDKEDVEQNALVLTPGALTIRNAGAAWMVLEMIEDAVARAKEEICSIGAFEAIPLSDGRVIGRLVTERRGLNGKVAAELLRERYGPAAAEYIEESVTLAAMRQAVVKHLRQGEKIETKAKTGIFDRLLVEVEQRGGLELKVTDAVRPHVPKKKPG